MTTAHYHNPNVAASCCAPRASTAHSSDSQSALESCCSVPANGYEGSEALSELHEEEVSPEVAALRSAGFRLLLEQGHPVDQGTWATSAGVDRSTLAEVMNRAGARGRVELDPEGRLTGIAGLSIEPTRHRIHIEGATRWAWCALDAVGILGALGGDGTVHSTDPGTGDQIEITFRNGKPEGDATLFILDGHADVNLKETWCPMVNFFTSRHAAEEWVKDHQLDGEIVSVAGVAEDAAAMWRPVVDQNAPQVC